MALLALLAPGKTVPPYQPSWKQRSLWNGSGTLRPTHYVCYLPKAKGGHAKHVETGQLVNDAHSTLLEVLMKIVSRWSAHHARSS